MNIPIPDEIAKHLQVTRYLAQALDPIHIGTGGERLSRVDMAIVREPGTDLPKLPGTSLSGACRAYAAMSTDNQRCAGQGQKKEGQPEEETGHCGKCEVCKTFGYAKGEAGGQKGAASFSDAHIVAFPVRSSQGPIWAASPTSLARLDPAFMKHPAKDSMITYRVKTEDKPSARLDLGWLLLPIDGQGDQRDLPKLMQQWIEPLALVPDRLFSTIVNTNLEIRTSVAIDPTTGAAEDGALFTYEAIPCGTYFTFDITYQKRFFDKAPPTVESGLKLFEWLGVGGMSTRGMGRLRVLGLENKQ